MKQEHFAIKMTTLLHAADQVSSDLDYLCLLSESPDEGFPIADAILYSAAVIALSNQLEFILEDLSENDLSPDEEYVKLSKDEVYSLNRYTDASEEALRLLEEICGISLKNN